MHINTLFATAISLASFAAGFEFTGPDPNEKLNFAAPLINITWTRGPPNATEYSYPTFDLWFGGPNADGAGGVGTGFELQANVSNTDGFFLWDPVNSTGSGDPKDPYLSEDKEFQFIAMFTHDGGDHNVFSEPYALEGYPRPSNGAGSLFGSVHLSSVVVATTLVCMLY